MDLEYAVIGGGLVGMAVAYGLQKLGRQVTVFDEGDRAFRASRGNFGLIWVQGKGVDMPEYARWTRRSAALWPEFADDLRAETGIDLELRQPGGLDIFLKPKELEEAGSRLEKLRNALDGDYPYQLLNHQSLSELLPEIGPNVVGATFHPEDGHVNPLYLLRALYAAFQKWGGTIVNDASVREIITRDYGFQIDNGTQFSARHVVLCAGLGNARLAQKVGLDAPVKPLRGQVLICERVKPFLRYPSVHIRQVGEGAVQIGDSKENAGFNDSTSSQVIAKIARRAVEVFPLLRQIRMVRAWGSLRVMSPDGHPIYDRSQSYPNATLVTCHSGVTLAAIHAKRLAGWISGEQHLDHMENFSAQRFKLRQAA